MINLFHKLVATALFLILLCQSALYISANGTQKDSFCEIMVYADEEYFKDINAAKKALSAIAGDNIEITDTYTLALFGFSAKIPAKYVKIIDESDYFDAHECGTFEALSAEECTYDTSALYAGEMLNLTKVHETGYTGKGTLVAVIDNGFDVTHEVFSSAPASPSLKKEDVDALIKSGGLVVSGVVQSADEIYVSEKIPYAFDYTLGKADVSTLDNHGTHVAALIGGLSERMTGVAPDCQLLLMKVFDTRAENAGEQFVAAALEDAIALGADVVNLSLGTYSGSASANKYSSINRMAKRLSRAGITVVCAGGNDGSAGFNSTFTEKYGIPYPLADMTDFGTVSHPAVIEDFIAVASAQNTHTSTDSLVHKDSRGNITRIEYTDTNASQNIIKSLFTEHFGQAEIEYVEIGGVGAPEDYAHSDSYLAGKIALVERGIITFSEKVNNAAKHGALAVIVYSNNDESEVYMDLSGCTIPAIFISKQDGEFLKNSAVKRLVFDGALREFVPNEDAYTMSLFSSWGVTPELTLKPDITSVGESIYSAVPGNTYASLTGTSMASPFISGMAALFNEKLDSEESKYLLAKRTSYIKNALMISATPLINPVMDCEYSPRSQGAGLADIAKALNTEFLITNSDGASSLTLEKDNGKYFLEFNIENLTDEEKEIELNASVLIDTYASVMLESDSGEKEYTFNTLNSSRIENAVLSANTEDGIYPSDKSGALRFTLGANTSCSVKIFITIDTEKLKTEAFENGYFIDGFLYARSDSFEGSVPFVGFEGDFNSSDIFDATIYSGEIPFFSGNSLVSETENKHFVTLGTSDAGNFTPAFSPNNDLNLDTLYLSASLLRNISYYRIEITDSENNVLYSSLETIPLTKGGSERHAPIPVWDGGDAYNSDFIFPDGDYILKISATAAGSNATGQLLIPFKTDTTAPSLVNYEVANADGKKSVSIKVHDESFVQSVTIYNTQSLDKKSKNAYSASEAYDGDDTFTFDITDVKNKTLWADITDFAMNTRTVKIVLE